MTYADETYEGTVFRSQGKQEYHKAVMLPDSEI